MVWQRLTVYGNQNPMWMKRRTFLGLFLVLYLICLWGCASRLAPATPPGVALTPGRYLTAYFRAPDFNPSQADYVIEPFALETVQGVPAETFSTLFMEELTQAWRANGLKRSPRGEYILTGVVQSVAIKGAAFRFIRGRIDGTLVVSATVTRGAETLFACQDRISLSSPINPGSPAPKEAELLLRLAARTFAGHLLDEMLLYWPPAEGK
jgi:hypothetical protein